MTLQTIAPNTESAILARLIQATDSLSRDVAEYLLSIDFGSSDIQRIDFLSERAQDGTLSAEETVELDSYLHVGSLVSIMQSKARRVLKSKDFSHLNR